jgi:(p)ppGpp synthase/HD superfamily hydrolase
MENQHKAGSGCSSHVLLASSIARKAHDGQFRRDGITPYITHPEAVAQSLDGEHPDVIAAAWLHDVLEDTQTSVVHLKNAGIPWQVIDAVELLTRDDGQPYEDYLHWITQDEIARKVKIADIRHNLSDAPTEKQIAKYGKALQYLANDKDLARRALNSE